jgi:hypothetical protein
MRDSRFAPALGALRLALCRMLAERLAALPTIPSGQVPSAKRQALQRSLALALALWGLGSSLFLRQALSRSKAQGEDVHRRDANCRSCHTADRDALDGDPAKARLSLRADLEATCNRCHGSQGPSHKTGVRATMSVPPALHLSSEGRLTCATCHYMHGESNRFGDFLRIDNRRGQLCLSCHQLSDLK